MVLAIVFMERDPRTGAQRQVVSHGVDTDTGASIVLPQVTPQFLGVVFDSEIGEYVLGEENGCRHAVRTF